MNKKKIILWISAITFFVSLIISNLISFRHHEEISFTKTYYKDSPDHTTLYDSHIELRSIKNQAALLQVKSIGDYLVVQNEKIEFGENDSSFYRGFMKVHSITDTSVHLTFFKKNTGYGESVLMVVATLLSALGSLLLYSLLQYIVHLHEIYKEAYPLSKYEKRRKKFKIIN